MSTPQTDTPETDEIRQSYEQQRASVGDILEELGSMERRAIAAEVRVKELEAQKWQDIKVTKGGETYSLGTLLPMLESEIAQACAALRLRPIAEAGPVSEGVIRLWAYWQEGFKCWNVKDIPVNDPTHFIDIYPPPQAEEGQQGGLA
jgi:hypothetical protein